MTALANLRALVAKWRDDASYAKYDEPYDHGRNDGLTQCADELEATLSPAELGGVEGPLRVFSEGAWVYEETGQRVRARDLDEAAFAEYLRHPLSTPRAAEAVTEEVQDAVDSILNQLGGWAKAYPLDIFREPTDEEREWLHTTKPGLMDRIAASMGRHMAKCIAEDLAALTAALTPMRDEILRIMRSEAAPIATWRISRRMPVSLRVTLWCRQELRRMEAEGIVRRSRYSTANNIVWELAP